MQRLDTERTCEVQQLMPSIIFKVPPGLDLPFHRAMDDGKALTQSTLSAIDGIVTRTPSMDSEYQDGESLPSIGSFGHPELCAPPCVYFAWGPCAKGSYCAFCHMAHREPIGKLDKRQRKIFQKLEEAEMIAVILPHLKVRAEQLEPCQELEVVLSVLSGRLQSQIHGDEKFVLTQRKVEKLNYVLRQMPFQGLVSLILAREDFEPSFLETLALATAKLRVHARSVGKKATHADLHWL